MTNSRTTSKVNTPIRLSDNSDFILTDNIACPLCGVIVRAIDAKPLRPGLRLLCRQHHLVFSFEPAAK